MLAMQISTALHSAINIVITMIADAMSSRGINSPGIDQFEFELKFDNNDCVHFILLWFVFNEKITSFKNLNMCTCKDILTFLSSDD